MKRNRKKRPVSRRWMERKRDKIEDHLMRHREDKLAFHALAVVEANLVIGMERRNQWIPMPTSLSDVPYTPLLLKKMRRRG
jgi:hypothetical protein